MANTTNRPWNLESFLDSLTLELDRARDTLAVKGINQPMTYSVKDLNLDLQLFPTFDGNQVRFVTAQPGEAGASKISISLSSISDRQIRQTTRAPASEDDLTLEEVDLDEETKTSLEKVGIRRVSDIEKLEKEQVNLQEVAKKAPVKGGLVSLADRLKKMRGIKTQHRAMSLKQENRKKNPPKVEDIRLRRKGNFAHIHLLGQRLKMDRHFRSQAFINGKPVTVLSSSEGEVILQAPGNSFAPGANHLKLILDGHTILTMNLK